MPERKIQSALRRRIAKLNEDFGNELKTALEEPAKSLTTKHRRVVGSWSKPNKPIFSYRITVGEKSVRLTVFPKGAGRQKYLWIDRGTKPFVIRPKNGKYLTFQAGYSPRTRPTARYNTGNGGRSGRFVRAQKVNHPGIAARKFSETFAKQILPDMQETIENSFRRAARQL